MALSTVDLLIEKLSQLDYVKAFQAVEMQLRADTSLWADYECMKALQKDAVLYQQIGKAQAYRETASQAQQLEKKLKQSPLVQDYFLKMQDVSDLLQYVTRELEERVNEGLEGVKSDV